MTVRIIPTTEQHIAGVHAAVDGIARERRYLAFVAGPPLEQAVGFIRSLIAGGGVHVVALDDTDQVVGWCDVVRVPLEGFRHTGP